MQKPIVKIFVVLFAIVLAYCCWSYLSTNRRETIQIRFWCGFGGPDGATILKLVSRYNQSHPESQVRIQRMDWATYYNKLFVAGLGGRAPEVFIIHASSMPRFAQTDFLQPIDELITGSNPIPIDDFDDNVWQGVTFNGQRLGLPFDIHPLGIYANASLFKQYGLVDANGQPVAPQTKEEFLNVLQTVRRQSPDRNTWGFTLTYYRTNVYTLMLQYGGRMFSDDYSRCTLDDPQNVAALEFVVDLIRESKLIPPPENTMSWIGFRQGKVAMVFEGIYMLQDLKKNDAMEFFVAPVPRIGVQDAVWADSHILCLKRNLDPATQSAVWDFMKYLSDHSLEWSAGGQLPVRRSLRNSDEFRAMPIQSTFARQIPYSHYMPQVPFLFEFQTEFDLAVDKAIRGRLSPQKALQEATIAVNKIILRHQNNRSKGQAAQS